MCRITQYHIWPCYRANRGTPGLGLLGCLPPQSNQRSRQGRSRKARVCAIAGSQWVAANGIYLPPWAQSVEVVQRRGNISLYRLPLLPLTVSASVLSRLHHKLTVFVVCHFDCPKGA